VRQSSRTRSFHELCSENPSEAIDRQTVFKDRLTDPLIQVNWAINAQIKPEPFFPQLHTFPAVWLYHNPVRRISPPAGGWISA
jgi:hypothetical protein